MTIGMIRTETSKPPKAEEKAIVQAAARPEVESGERGVIPKTIDELWRVSQCFAASNMVPKQYAGRPEAVLVAIEMGLELGMRPMQAIRSIMVVNGIPTVYGDALLGLCQASGAFEFRAFREEWTGAGDTRTAHCTVGRRGTKPIMRSFSMLDAKRAGLTSKAGSLYQFYPDRMLQMRARAFALRDAFPDVLQGLYAREEIADDANSGDFVPQPDVTATITPNKSAAEPIHKTDELAGRILINLQADDVTTEPGEEGNADAPA